MASSHAQGKPAPMAPIKQIPVHPIMRIMIGSNCNISFLSYFLDELPLPDNDPDDEDESP